MLFFARHIHVDFLGVFEMAWECAKWSHSAPFSFFALIFPSHPIPAPCRLAVSGMGLTQS